MKNCKLFELNFFEDERGKLVPLVDKGLMPFDVKRIYYILGNKNNITRGKLAHKSLEQILVCVNGSCGLLLDDGICKKTYELNKFNKALYIENNIWREIFDFSSDCILLSLNSEFHDENELIRDYNKFLKIKGINK